MRLAWPWLLRIIVLAAGGGEVELARERGTGRTGEAEIDDAHATVAADQDVVGFEIIPQPGQGPAG